MKKLFTLFAFLTMFLGAKAELVEVYSIDYSQNTGFPFYVMGYVPEWFDGVMTDFGAMYKYVAVEGAEETSDVIVKTQQGVEYYKIALAEPGWHQYFIADGIPTEIDGKFKVVAMVKASEQVNINVNMGWGWSDGQQVGTSVTIGTDWQEVEWEYSGIGGASCNLVAQPGTSAATIEWKWVKVYQDKKQSRPVEWVEDIVNGNAEKTWAEMGLEGTLFNDQENNFKICAWGKEREVNMNAEGGWDPFPATIGEETVNGQTNHYFIVHGKQATTEGDAAAWDNQFWIQSPQEWKAGTQLKIKFRYKASKSVTVATQCHKQTPSDYLIWHAIGDISFTEDWQEFDGTMTIADDMAGTWSIAFQLNQNDKEAIDFYFDDLSWQHMKLDEGYFVAGCNTKTGLEYDLDNAIEFVEGVDVTGTSCLVATVGAPGEYVNQIMVSTVRGNDAAFKGATLKPNGTIANDPEEWLDYTASSLAKLNLPGEGVWKVYLDPGFKSMAFQMLEGTTTDPLPEIANPTEIIINGVERDDLKDNLNNGEITVREEADDPAGATVGGTGHEGQTWDNQFWIVANRALEKGTATVLKFKYMASKEAKTTTQCHKDPGNYLHWGAIGDVVFTTEWQDFEQTFTVPDEADGMLSIAFNMAEIKEACDYHIKDVIWMTEDHFETLINTSGSENFFVKVGAGANPTQYEGGAGISSVTNTNRVSNVNYNLAGQRVSKDYKGIVVNNGRKYIVK